MTRDERSALFRSISIVVRRYVSNAAQTLSARLDEFDQRLLAIPAGRDGKDGIDGKDGAPGINGKDGLDGKDGIDGANGRDGVDGKDGAAGLNGKDGLPGKNGRDGIDGKDGAPGINGKDGIAGERGLTGEKGDTGEAGERGPIGLTGPAGMRGEKGEPGELGPRGERGEKGMDGKDGRDGRDGKDGLHGRDALEIDILPTIDPEKSYPRGTFASYEGGTIRAIRDNASAKRPEDWQVITNGFGLPMLSQEADFRTFKIAFRMTNGQTTEGTFRLPTLLYQGIYKSGTTYSRGDCVTQKDLWYCVAESTSIPPATPNNKDWVLMVRSGKDGKSFEATKPPDSGPLKLK